MGAPPVQNLVTALIQLTAEDAEYAEGRHL